MIHITLNQILASDPCADGWAKILHARGKITEQQMQDAVDGGVVPKSYNKLADDEAFPLSLAMESNGLDDVLWSLRCLPDEHRLWRKYAVWCARQVQHLMTDPRSTNALDVADRHADGLASDDELAAARAAAGDAGDAAWAAARAAARAAAVDAVDAGDAAWAAQKVKLLQILEAGHWVDDK